MKYKAMFIKMWGFTPQIELYEIEDDILMEADEEYARNGQWMDVYLTVREQGRLIEDWTEIDLEEIDYALEAIEGETV